MRYILQFLLKKEFIRHKDTRHDYRDCIFCYITPADQEKFWNEEIKGLK